MTTEMQPIYISDKIWGFILDQRRCNCKERRQRLTKRSVWIKAETFGVL